MMEKRVDERMEETMEETMAATRDGKAAERMVITRVIEAPRAVVWRAWTEPKYVMQWWGPAGFTVPECRADFRVGGRYLYCMRSPEGQEFWSGGEYYEIVEGEKIVSSMYFADKDGNRVDAEAYGVEHRALEEVCDVTLFEDAGEGRTRVTFIGNETMEDARASGQAAGWEQILEKLAAVVAGMEAAG